MIEIKRALFSNQFVQKMDELYGQLWAEMDEDLLDYDAKFPNKICFQFDICGLIVDDIHYYNDETIVSLLFVQKRIFDKNFTKVEKDALIDGFSLKNLIEFGVYNIAINGLVMFLNSGIKNYIQTSSKLGVSLKKESNLVITERRRILHVVHSRTPINYFIIKSFPEIHDATGRIISVMRFKMDYSKTEGLYMELPDNLKQVYEGRGVHGGENH